MRAKLVSKTHLLISAGFRKSTGYLEPTSRWPYLEPTSLAAALIIRLRGAIRGQHMSKYLLADRQQRDSVGVLGGGMHRAAYAGNGNVCWLVKEKYSYPAESKIIIREETWKPSADITIREAQEKAVDIMSAANGGLGSLSNFSKRLLLGSLFHLQDYNSASSTLGSCRATVWNEFQRNVSGLHPPGGGSGFGDKVGRDRGPVGFQCRAGTTSGQLEPLRQMRGHLESGHP